MNYPPYDLTSQNIHLYEFTRTTQEMNEYIKTISNLVKHEYQIGKLDIYAYERIINCMTVVMLQAEEIGKKSKEVAAKNVRMFTAQTPTHKRIIDTSA